MKYKNRGNGTQKSIRNIPTWKTGIPFGSCLLWVMSTEISVDIAFDIAVDIAVDSRSTVGRY